MGHNLAIVIGINEYERLKKLKYAKQDALKIKGFLEERGEVESVLLFTDDSEPIDGKPTRATHTNIRDLLVSMFEERFLSSEDNLWFFFSGHGLRHDQRDYLLPIDGNPRDIDGTGITVKFVTERLSRSGADNIVLILDACRNALPGAKGGGELGYEATERVREKGLISIFSCQPDEQSWEEDTLGQGIFTFALMKALQEGGCATAGQINSYLKIEVPALAKRYGNPPQTPRLVSDPIEKANLILVLKNTKEADLLGLKKAALEQEAVENFDSALELWNRVNIASQGRDREFVAAFERLQMKRLRQKEETKPSKIDPRPAKARQDLLATRDKEKTERERERAVTRLNYLDPLLVSAREYAERLRYIQEKVESGGDTLKWMVYQFNQVRDNPRKDLTEHTEWCNGEGYFAVSTNYLTAVYFFHANKVRREVAKSALSPSEARTLLEELSRVRTALGIINGIWPTLQDSAGDYVRCEDGTLLGYRNFCEQIFKVEERARILRLLDFYREIHERTDEERKGMIQSLKDLIRSIEDMGNSKK